MKNVGVLCAVSSLEGRHSIGEFGPSVLKFLDILKRNKITHWQILPLNPLGYGNSPYQTYSSFAIDPIYLSYDWLLKAKLVSKKANDEDLNYIDYKRARLFKEALISEAYHNYIKNNFFDYHEFSINNPGLAEYACFISLKKFFNEVSWNRWDSQHLNSKADIDELPIEIQEYAKMQLFAQKILFEQWRDIKSYANSKGIKIIGDLPFYVGYDSSDVYYAKEFFLLDNDFNPTLIAGVPPDYFSKDGQRWGNPIYNWQSLERDHFGFLIYRLKCASEIYDVVRLDHFRAFDSYWAINPDCSTAIDGKWHYPPGYKFFDTLFNQYPDIHLIAEDLGDLRKEVAILKDHFHLPGMKVMQFSLLDELSSDYSNGEVNTIYYTGTHDNDTLRGWYHSLSKKKRALIDKYHVRYHRNFDYLDKLLYLAINRNERLTIIPVQDILRLSSSSRMNTPSTITKNNWTFKLKNYDALKRNAVFIKKCIR
ncbi:MAG: 4-alpha-glucanotransferase [Bacilli bacterium]|jgi:4-alpha-glucanotransferase